MKIRISILFIIVTLISCDRNKKLEYKDSTNMYYVRLKESIKDEIKDTLAIFYDFNNPAIVKQVGFYKDGFRNGYWDYNLKDSMIRIKWGHYKDKYLGFETNMFASADSTKFGDFFTKFLFSTTSGKIILSISINSQIKDSLFKKSYEQMSKNEFDNLGVSVLRYQTSEIRSSLNNKIFISDIIIQLANNERKYIRLAHGFLSKDFIEFSVGSSNKNDFYANTLFNAVLTNFYLNGKRLYDPLKEIN